MGYPQFALAESLATHYSRFRVTQRILLTGHSHQAWPDAGFAGQQQAWFDAAECVDDKWERAVAKAEAVKAGFSRLLDDDASNLALGVNTHELVTRWLSALPIRTRPRIVTTDGEFHTVRRQLARLAEERLEVVIAPARPVELLAERLANAVDDRTACVIVSSVMFETAEIVPDLAMLAQRCRRHGVALLVDVYHHLNAVPFRIRDAGLEDAWVTGGGYKYCQLGEGNCFLRVPPGTRMRPVLTGWFAEFERLEHGSAVAPAAGRALSGAVLPGAGPPGQVVYHPAGDSRVSYGSGAAAFAGATYDPTSHYRAAAVFDFHRRHELTPDRLRDISVAQVTRLEEAIADLDLSPDVLAVIRVPPERRGGFLALRTAHSADLVRRLRTRGVFADARGSILRLGPAPYVTERQLRDAAAAIGEEIREMA